MKIHAFRISPGKDLRQEIEKYVTSKKMKAASIVTCVGNLDKALLRMAGGKVVKNFEGPLEIVSLVGTIEPGNSHLHVSLSDAKGKVVGGHLKNGTIVGVTAEIVIAELKNLKFSRKFDKRTGYDELVVTSR